MYVSCSANDVAVAVGGGASAAVSAANARVHVRYESMWIATNMCV